MLDLGSLGGTFGFPDALNNRGQVVGQMNTEGDLAAHPFLWDRGVLEDLGTFGGSLGEGNWLNDAGDVVGWASYPGDQVLHAALWKKGVMTEVGTVGGDVWSFAFAINSEGQIVGGSGAQFQFPLQGKGSPSPAPHPRKSRFAQIRRDGTAVQIPSRNLFGLSHYKAISLIEKFAMHINTPPP